MSILPEILNLAAEDTRCTGIKFYNGEDVEVLTYAQLKKNSLRICSGLLENGFSSGDKIIIATDADREGESIGLEALGYALAGNKDMVVSRAYFSAITKNPLAIFSESGNRVIMISTYFNGNVISIRDKNTIS